MSIQKLERVMWRLRERSNKNDKLVDTRQIVVHKKDLMRAIMVECGTCEATYTRTKHALRMLEWIKKIDSDHYALTGKDLSGEY